MSRTIDTGTSARLCRLVEGSSGIDTNEEFTLRHWEFGPRLQGWPVTSCGAVPRNVGLTVVIVRP